MDARRKPLAKAGGLRTLRASGLEVQWRGTPGVDDWVAFIARGTRSKRVILAAQTSERRGRGRGRQNEPRTQPENGGRPPGPTRAPRSGTPKGAGGGQGKPG